jgi:hypothetical protein
MPKKKKLEDGAYLIGISERMRLDVIRIKIHLGGFLMKRNRIHKEADSLHKAVNEFHSHLQEIFSDQDSNEEANRP